MLREEVNNTLIKKHNTYCLSFAYSNTNIFIYQKVWRGYHWKKRPLAWIPW